MQSWSERHLGLPSVGSQPNHTNRSRRFASYSMLWSTNSIRTPHDQITGHVPVLAETKFLVYLSSLGQRLLAARTDLIVGP